MDQLFDKIAYIKGLSDGLDISEDTKEGKLLVKIVDILDEMVSAIDDLYVANEQMEEYIEFIDEDLSDLEEEVFGIVDYEDDEEFEAYDLYEDFDEESEDEDLEN